MGDGWGWCTGLTTLDSTTFLDCFGPGSSPWGPSHIRCSEAPKIKKSRCFYGRCWWLTRSTEWYTYDILMIYLWYTSLLGLPNDRAIEVSFSGKAILPGLAWNFKTISFSRKTFTDHEVCSCYALLRPLISLLRGSEAQISWNFLLLQVAPQQPEPHPALGWSRTVPISNNAMKVGKATSKG
jgi:hypothetical protein